MEKQTAVQWAINEIAVKWHYIESGEVLLSDIMDKAMAIEKDKTIQAYSTGWHDGQEVIMNKVKAIEYEVKGGDEAGKNYLSDTYGD